MVKKLTLNEDHIKLIQYLNIEEFEFGEKSKHDRFGWGFDQWNLFGGTYVMEDIAIILGQYDKAIPGTEESPQGRQFPKELEDYWWELYEYIYKNFTMIMKLVLYFAGNGGITPGTYKYSKGAFKKIEQDTNVEQ